MGLITVESTTKGIRWTNDGMAIRSARSLAEVLEQVDEPHAFVCEPAFFDGLRDVRHSLEEWLAESGHYLFPMTSGAKEVLRSAGGFLVSGRGVSRQYSLATVGSDHLDRDAVQGRDTWNVRDALEVAHAVDVFHDPERALGRAIDVVGPYSTLDASVRGALGDGQAYRADVILAACRAATVASSRGEFERFLGLSSAGHGALTHTIRTWRAARCDELGDAELTWPEYRRALRTIYHLVKSANRSAVGAA